MTGFTLLEHTSEIGFESEGTTLEEAFAEAGKALFEIMTDISSLTAEEQVDIRVESENLESLLFDYIDELNYVAQGEGILLRDFDLTVAETGDGYKLTGTGEGQRIQSGMRLQEVKAPTYSDMVVEENQDGWRLQMFLDV